MAEIQIKLSDLAIQDMVSIEDYTARMWGDNQTDEYLDQLEQRFCWLAEHVKAGKSRGDIAQGLFSFPQGRHIIFYRSKGLILEIARVLHQSMDIEHQFD
jgi:toxin ParE1/3/4